MLVALLAMAGIATAQTPQEAKAAKQKAKQATAARRAATNTGTLYKYNDDVQCWNRYEAGGEYYCNGFDIVVKHNDQWLQTTFSNRGYRTYIQVGEGTKQPLYSDWAYDDPNTVLFEFGRTYTVDDINVVIDAEVPEGSKAVNIKYTVTNNSNERKTLKLGSCADTQLGNNDNAVISREGNVITMSDSGTGASYSIAISSNATDPASMWYGGCGWIYDKVFDNTPAGTPFSGDSGLAWSWSITLKPNETKVFTAGGGSVVVNEPIVSDIVLDLPTGGDITAALNDKIAEIAAAEGRDVIAGNVSINLGFMAKATISKPIVASKTVSIKGDNATIDASANAGALIKMNNEPSVALNEKGKAYEVGEFLIEGVTFKGVNSYVYDDQKIPYVYSSYTINNCVFEFTNNKSDIDCPFRFQGGAPLKFVLTNSTLYKNGSNTFKYLVKMSNTAGNAPDALVDLVDYEWQIENNTFFGVTSSTELMNNGRVANNYTKTSVTLNKNIFVDCASSSKDFLKNLFGSKYNDTDVAKFKKYESNLNTYFSDGKDVSAKQERYDRGMILTTDPGFKDAANGDFTIGKRTHQNLYQTGDPRWLKDTEDYIAPQVGVSGTAAIDLTVPANLGKMDGTNGPTDLALFLDSYLQNSPNPAYIKLTLEPGAKYTISKPLTTMTAITIVGDESNPALIDASSLTGSFVEADELYAAGDPNANDFLTSIYNVEFKNFIVEKAQGSLFSSNGQKYDILYMTIDNVVYEAMNSGKPLISLLDGGIVENLTMTRSTAYMSGYLYNGNGSAKLAEAGVNSQKFTFSYNTLVETYGLVHADDSESAKRTINVDHNVIMEPTANFVTDLNAGDANCIVQYNAFLSMPDIRDGVYNDISNAEDANGAAGSIKGNMVWVNTDKLAEDLGDGVINFPMGDCPQRDAKIGDPRWLSAKMRIKEADVDDENDLAKVINEGVKKGYTEFELVQNQYGNLRYTVKQSIVTDKAISITGENVQIDVEHSDPFIQLSTTPAEAAVNDYFRIDQILLKGLEIKGIKNSIIYDNNTKYCVVDLTIDDCVLGLETEAVKNEALISFQAGGVKDFTIKNSTVYGNNAVAKYFIRYNNSARLDRYGFDKNTEFQTMTYQNNTFYGLLKSDGQWGNYNGIAGQNYSKFVVEKNIWYNSSNEIIRRMAGGRFGSNAPQTFDKNTYFLNGADNSAKEAGYDKSGTALTTDPGFKKPAEGDFTLSAYSAQCNEKTGDPRWLAEGGHYNPVTGIETVKTAEETSLENAVIYNLNGQRVEKAQKGINIVNGKKVIIK